jgi:large conductance mechanosensitive channel
MADEKPVEKVGVVQEFKDFLTEYKVMGLAVAFVMGVAITALVNSLVANIIMPVIGVLLPGGDWQTMKVALGPINFGIGAFIAALINFIIIALVIFFIVKFAMGEKKVTKK